MQSDLSQHLDSDLTGEGRVCVWGALGCVGVQRWQVPWGCFMAGNWGLFSSQVSHTAPPCTLQLRHPCTALHPCTAALHCTTALRPTCSCRASPPSKGGSNPVCRQQTARQALWLAPLSADPCAAPQPGDCITTVRKSCEPDRVLGAVRCSLSLSLPLMAPYTAR